MSMKFSFQLIGSLSMSRGNYQSDLEFQDTLRREIGPDS